MGGYIFGSIMRLIMHMMAGMTSLSPANAKATTIPIMGDRINSHPAYSPLLLTAIIATTITLINDNTVIAAAPISQNISGEHGITFGFLIKVLLGGTG